MSTAQTGTGNLLEQQHLSTQTMAILLGKGAIPAAEKKMGVEIEMPFVKTADLKPLPFKGDKSITALFNALVAGESWQAAEIENGYITSLKGQSGNIMLEPGGQVEYAGAPRSSLLQIAADIDQYIQDLQTISSDLAIDVVPFGFHPHLGLDEIPFISERSRFLALKPVFEAEEGFAAWGQSSSVQLTLDGAAMPDAFAAFKLGLQLQPIAAAIFANSPFLMSADSGYQSTRREKLLALDSPYYAIPDDIFNADYTMQNWAEHILQVPMSFIVRNDAYIAVAPKPFASMVGVPLPELQHLPVEQQYLTENDLRDHITGIKPEMLLKPNLLLEFRAADLGPTPQHWLALAAFWTGIFYDPKAFKAAEEYVATWTPKERKFIRQHVAKDGLNTQYQNINVAKVAEDLLAISLGGLKNIEPAAVGMLDILHTQISEVATPASKILAEFHENKGDMVTTLQQNLLLAPKSKKAVQSMS